MGVGWFGAAQPLQLAGHRGTGVGFLAGNSRLHLRHVVARIFAHSLSGRWVITCHQPRGVFC